MYYRARVEYVTARVGYYVARAGYSTARVECNMHSTRYQTNKTGTHTSRGRYSMACLG